MERVSMSKKILLTGGGTAGHVTPNLALIEKLRDKAWHIEYMGSDLGVEKEMIDAVGVPFHAIRSGKLRRYFSWQNFIDPINILIGIVQATFKVHAIKPDIVFSKGGFVAFPVVVGAWVNRVPVVAHESDLSPGLANRLSFPFAKTICLTFAAAQKRFKNQAKTVVTGTPIREQLFKGNKDAAYSHCGFKNNKPCILVIGGSLGSTSINACVRSSIDDLLSTHHVIHICGKGNIDATLVDKEGYFQTEYAEAELADFFAASELIISRSGANSLYEILALNKPHVLIPLSKKSSRGDQIENAHFFEQQGISVVINEEQLDKQSLMSALEKTLNSKDKRIEKMKQLNIKSSTNSVIDVLIQKMK